MKLELTVSFKHPRGPACGLDAIHALEKELARRGCRFLDHGTLFKHGGKYIGSDTTVGCRKKVPHGVIRSVLKDEGVRTFRVKYEKESA